MDRVSMRRAILLGGPLLMAVSSVVHPHPPFRRPGMHEFLQTRLALWMGVHVVQLFLVLLLGLTLWFLVEGLAGRAATVSRLATAFFLVFYAAFDSVVGIGTGLLDQVVRADPPLEPAVAASVVDQFWLARFDLPVGPLIGIANVAWIGACIAAAVALRAHGAPRAAIALLIVAAISFGIDHPSPTGTIGMLALFAANLMLLRRGLVASAA
jgi:hypothetical protein